MSMSDRRAANMETIQRSDEASALKGILDTYLNETIRGLLGSLVGHYRSSQIEHDILVGKIAEISALMALGASFDAEMRAGDAARDREYGNGTTAQQTPGPRSRPKSS